MQIYRKIVMRYVESPFLCRAQNEMCLMSHTVYILCRDENALLWEEDEYHFLGDLAGFFFIFIFKRRYCGMILRLSTHFEVCSGCFTAPSSFPSPHKYNKKGLN